MRNPIQLIVAFFELAKKWAKSYTDAAIANLPKAIVYKGAVDYYADLPATGQKIGDAYTVEYEGSSGTVLSGAEYVWSLRNGVEQWVYFGPDISRKADKPSTHTTGNLAGLDANGNLVDAGCTAASKANLVDGKVPKAEIPLTIAIDQSTLTITY